MKKIALKIALLAVFSLILTSGCASSQVKAGGQGSGAHSIQSSSHAIGVKACVPAQAKKGGRMCFIPGAAGLWLIAIGLGYLVFLAAKKEKKELKDLGLAIGVIMMVLGTFFLVTSLYYKLKPFLKGSCPLTTKQHSYQQLPKEQEPPELGFSLKR